MKPTSALSVFACVLLPVCSAIAETPTARIVSAANAFLATLDQKQRQTVLFAFDDEQQRARWSNLPVGAVPRGGLSLREMSPAQRSAAMALVASALSARGFEKVQQIMEGDEVNKNNEANGGGRGPGGGRGRGPGGPPPGDGNNPVFAPGGPPFGRGGARCSGAISITFPSSERHPKRIRGCFSSGAITWRSTSPLRANKAFSRPL